RPPSPLPLHDALPISPLPLPNSPPIMAPAAAPEPPPMIPPLVVLFMVPQLPSRMAPLSRNAVIFIFFIPFIFLIGSSFTNANLRSEEHTSELQSRFDL